MDQSREQLPARHGLVERQRVTGTDLLLFLRIVELIYMIVCLKWIWDSPKSRLRDTRLIACWIIVMLNLFAITIFLSWPGVVVW